MLQEIYEAYFWFFKRCEEYFLCKYQPPEGVRSVGEHVELEIRLYLERFPPQQRHLRRLIFDYLLKRECCITGSHEPEKVSTKFSESQYTRIFVNAFSCEARVLTPPRVQGAPAWTRWTC